MASGIGFPDVGFDLYDDAARPDAAADVDQNFTDEIARDVKGRAIVESAGQLH
jgi:hypothetical protein